MRKKLFCDILPSSYKNTKRNFFDWNLFPKLNFRFTQSAQIIENASVNESFFCCKKIQGNERKFNLETYWISFCVFLLLSNKPGDTRLTIYLNTSLHRARWQFFNGWTWQHVPIHPSFWWRTSLTIPANKGKERKCQRTQFSCENRNERFCNNLHQLKIQLKSNWTSKLTMMRVQICSCPTSMP